MNPLNPKGIKSQSEESSMVPWIEEMVNGHVPVNGSVTSVSSIPRYPMLL
jgi:hypothetical protein